MLTGDGLPNPLFTIERPWVRNRNRDSCIPPAPGGEAVYNIARRNVPWSRFDYEHIIVEGVPGRSAILFHRGNYYTQSEGCILVGLDFGWVNGDGMIDVVDSREALGELVGSVPESGEKLKVSWTKEAQTWDVRELGTIEPRHLISEVNLA